MKTILLFQVVVGALGNVFLFSHSIPLVVLDRKRRHRWDSHTLGPGQPPGSLPWHSSHCHCSSCVTEACRVSGVFVYYVQRVARSTALCSTCVLSTYQSLMLTPRRAEWVMLRGKALKVTGPSCCTCWMFSLLMYIYVPVKITGPWDRYNNSDSQGKWFCSISGTVTVFGYLWFISDAMFITLMVWSSGSTVLLLHRHHQRVQYLHTPAGHHRCPPETRAAHTILMLMVTFVTFYLLNYSLVFHISASSDFRLWLLQVSNILVSCFPLFSPSCCS